MKKLAISIMLCFHTIFLSAQIEKYSVEIGGAGMFIHDLGLRSQDTQTRGFVLKGNVGFFPLKNISVGINPYTSMLKDKFQPPSFFPSEVNYWVSGLNVYMRYYPIHAKRFNFFGEISSGFGSLNFSKQSTERIYGDYALYSISVGVGANYFLNKKLAIQLLIPYLKTYQLSDTSLSGSQTFTFNTLAPTIGLQYYISPK